MKDQYLSHHNLSFKKKKKLHTKHEFIDPVYVGEINTLEVSLNN